MIPKPALPGLPSTMPPASPTRIVIDTNVCLDLFVFHDPRWHALLAALENGSVQAFTRADCRMEWLTVLGYRQLPLDEHSRPVCIARFDALIQMAATSGNAARCTIPLPLCRDPDDQKFLELARDTGADQLITKDKALLKLARKVARAGMFAIITPEQWSPRQAPAGMDAGPRACG